MNEWMNELIKVIIVNKLKYNNNKTIKNALLEIKLVTKKTFLKKLIT